MKRMLWIAAMSLLLVACVLGITGCQTGETPSEGTTTSVAEPDSTEAPATEAVTTETPVTEAPVTEPVTTEALETACVHTYDSIVVDATCTVDGSRVTTCTKCGDTATEVLPATGHEHTTVTTEATCTVDGSKVTTCAKCGDTATEVLPATGHEHTTVTTEATCTVDGSKVTTCAKCGDTATEVLPATGHEHTTVTTEATCTVDGSKVTTCTKCGDTATEVIPAVGHDTKTTTTVAATCTAKGEKVTTCSRCDYTKTASIKAKGHKLSTTATEATCTANGSKVTTCSRCDHKTVETISALGHDTTTTITTAATCKKSGSKVTACSRCDHSVTETIPALGHDTTTRITTAATCTADGRKETTCSRCNYRMPGTVPATGHDYKATTTPATETEDGKIKSICKNCRDTKIEILPALGNHLTLVEDLTEGVVARQNGYVYVNAESKLLSLGGLAAPSQNNGEYFRLNAANKNAYPEDIRREAATTAGGTLRFRVNGGTFRIKAIRRTDVDYVARDSYAFDIYLGSGTGRTLWKTVKASSFYGNFESAELVLPEGAQEVMICLPRTVGFTSIQVAFKEGTRVGEAPDRIGGKIGFYGSSISHGYSASSPSLSYAMTLCRSLDADCVNFGMSGAARGEKAVIDDICAKIKGLGLTAFVLEYDWNINSSIELEYGSTYWNGYPYYTIYEKLRAALGPDVPIIMISRPYFGYGSAGISEAEVNNCINVISRACDKAKAAGDHAVAFISGKTFFGNEGGICHADNIHPNDKGCAMMAAKIKETLVPFLPLW